MKNLILLYLVDFNEQYRSTLADRERFRRECGYIALGCFFIAGIVAAIGFVGL